MPNKSAVIIKGNQALVKNNKQASLFYQDLAFLLEKLGFSVEIDSGEPFTVPKPADLWIGHSRGADRLRFAPSGTKVIGIGVPESTGDDDFPIVNHPDDEMVKLKFSKGKIVIGEEDNKIDDTNHYILTDDMKMEIKNIIEEK